MWLGLLFAILAMGAQFQAAFGNHEVTLQGVATSSLFTARIDFYREKGGQCLILEHYAKWRRDKRQVFILYLRAGCLRWEESQFRISILVEIVVRVGFRIGYHREASRFSDISPFRAEMRG